VRKALIHFLFRQLLVFDIKRIDCWHEEQLRNPKVLFVWHCAVNQLITMIGSVAVIRGGLSRTFCRTFAC